MARETEQPRLEKTVTNLLQGAKSQADTKCRGQTFIPYIPYWNDFFS
jgi:hypothetical protein